MIWEVMQDVAHIVLLSVTPQNTPMNHWDIKYNPSDHGSDTVLLPKC